MKRLLSILIVALLLCAPFTCASAKTITGTETFTAPGELFEPYEYRGEHFSIYSSFADSITGIRWGRNRAFSITSIDDSVIDRIEATVKIQGDFYNMITVKPGTKKETGPVKNGDPVHIENIDSTSFETDGGAYVYVDNIVVYYHKDIPDPVPATGDTATPALWLTLALASAGGLAVLAVRRRREL